MTGMGFIWNWSKDIYTEFYDVLWSLESQYIVGTFKSSDAAFNWLVTFRCQLLLIFSSQSLEKFWNEKFHYGIFQYSIFVGQLRCYWLLSLQEQKPIHFKDLKVSLNPGNGMRNIGFCATLMVMFNTNINYFLCFIDTVL